MGTVLSCAKIVEATHHSPDHRSPASAPVAPVIGAPVPPSRGDLTSGAAPAGQAGRADRRLHDRGGRLGVRRARLPAAGAQPRRLQLVHRTRAAGRSADDAHEPRRLPRADAPRPSLDPLLSQGLGGTAGAPQCFQMQREVRTRFARGGDKEPARGSPVEGGQADLTASNRLQMGSTRAPRVPATARG